MLVCSLGAVADLALAINCKKINDDVMVVSCDHTFLPYNMPRPQVAGDMLFDHTFDIAQVIDYFRLKVCLLPATCSVCDATVER